MEPQGPHNETPGIPRQSISDRWVLVFVLLVMICGGTLRLGGLDRIGLKGSDNTTYTNIARHWSEGDRVYSIGRSHTMYRPVAYATYGMAVRLFGYNDTSIKMVNATLDTINILLVYLLAFILSRRDPWTALAAAAIYALLPFTILISRSELTHTLSTTTLLVATLLFSLAWLADSRSATLILTLLAGVFTGLCALTHEEMIFTAVAPTLFLLLRPGSRSDSVRARLIATASLVGAYFFGVMTAACRMLRIHQANAQERAVDIVDHRISHDHYLRFLYRPLKYAWNAVTGSSSNLLACLVIVLLFVLIVRFVLRRKNDRTGWDFPAPAIEDLPIWIVATHLLTYGFFFNYYAVRLFLPLIPLVIVWLVVRSTSLTTHVAGRTASRGALAVLTIAVVTADLGHIHTFRESMTSRFAAWTPFSPASDFNLRSGWSTLQTELTKKSWTRLRYEELGRVVNENSRLLVGASTFHPFAGRRSIQIGYYFGDNAIHLFDHEEPLEQLIREKKIEFVLFTPFQAVTRPLDRWGLWQRYLYDNRWGPHRPVVLGKSLGFGPGEYTLTGEFERLRTRMARRGARIILGHRDLLEKRPSWADPVSFVVWVLDPKNWPPLAQEIELTTRCLELVSEGHVRKGLAELNAADIPELSEMGRFRLRLTEARILIEHDHPGKARKSVAAALACLPRNTTVSTVLREAFPTPAATEEMYGLFNELREAKPRNQATRDLLLALSLNLAEFAMETGDKPGLIEALGTMEDLLGTSGSRKFRVATAKWCNATARDLERDGRVGEAEAALAAAATVEEH